MIHIKDTGVKLYTHWHGSKIQNYLANALAQKARWNDPAYLSRIIFEEMVSHASNDHTGFGIYTNDVAHAKPIIKVDCSTQTVVYNVEEYSFEEFAERAETEEVAE